jgi:ABC-2 type transport system permease protein
VARKEFIHVLRDPRALGISLVLPVFLLFLFGYALTLDVDDVPLVVWDRSGTPASRELVSRFEGSRYFTIRGVAESYADLEATFGKGEALAALVIPSDFARCLSSKEGAVVQVILDGSDANTATLVEAYAESVVGGFGRTLRLEVARRVLGLSPAPPLDLRARVWFNTAMESRYAIVPGLIAVILQIIAALLTSLTVAREWETGTMEQLLSTPVRGSELVLGKLAPYFAIGMVDLLVSAAAGRVIFGVPFRGSLVPLLGMSALFLLGSLSLGILISILAKNQLLASQVAFVATYLPALLLSGFMFDIANMPAPLRAVTYAVPARYFIRLLRSLFLKGVGVEVLWREGIFLFAFALLAAAAALAAFRKRLE